MCASRSLSFERSIIITRTHTPNTHSGGWMQSKVPPSYKDLRRPHNTASHRGTASWAVAEKTVRIEFQCTLLKNLLRDHPPPTDQIRTRPPERKRSSFSAEPVLQAGEVVQAAGWKTQTCCPRRCCGWKTWTCCQKRRCGPSTASGGKGSAGWV